MRNILGFTIGGLLLVTGAAYGQTTPSKPAFEVASVKPAAPLDPAKIRDAMQNGGKLPVGANIEASRAQYTYMALKELIAMAYKVKPYQITGPDWIATERFDIIAKIPDGAPKSDVPKMLQALLEDRFKLTVHRDSQEHPVLALVVGKGGPKLKESATAPQPIDEDAPLKPGEVKTDMADGPARMTVDMKTGGATVNMGVKGTVAYKVDPATMTMHMNASQISMSGLVDMLTQFSQMTGGGGRQVVDMTGLKGNYEVSLDFSMADLIAMARAQGMDVPAGVGGGAPGAPGAAVASDPSGGSSLFDAVSSLGLKLEQRKAVVDQFVIDHIEKTPTEN